MSPNFLSGGLVKGEDGTAAGNINHAIRNSRRLCQRAKIVRGECPAADTGNLIDSDCIATIGNVRCVTAHCWRRCDGTGFVVAPNLSSSGRIIRSEVAAAVADEEQVIAECGLHSAFSRTGQARPPRRTVVLLKGVYAPITCDKDGSKPKRGRGAFLPEGIAGPKERELGNIGWIKKCFGIVVASVRGIKAILTPGRVGTAVESEKDSDGDEDCGFDETETPKTSGKS